MGQQMTEPIFKDEIQPALFEEVEDWQKEWKGMPEFIQGKIEPYSTIIIRCEKKENLEELSKLLGQPLTSKTKSIWHPQLVRGLNSGKRYVNESKVSDIHSIEGSVEK